MNIFVILLVAVFMGLYYFMDSPNLTTPEESRSEAMDIMELKSIISCVMHSQTNALVQDETHDIDEAKIFDTDLPCAERYEVMTQKICADERRILPTCTPDRPDRQISNYIITTSDIITDVGAGKILDILRTEYPYAANFGIISIDEDKKPHILTSGGLRREIAPFLAREASFQDGQLIYITQYAVSGNRSAAVQAQRQRIKCARGEIAVFRQNAWTCVPQNIAPVCGAATVWDRDNKVCVPDNSRRPLCHRNQNAVMVDGNWECVNPEERTDCRAGTRPEFNFENLEWNCVPVADAALEKKHCPRIYERMFGGGTTALRGSLISCNDCEQMMVHDDCTAECVPDASATSKNSCYNGTCVGYFYFGFPNAKYIEGAKKHLSELQNMDIQMTLEHSRNRRFNCIRCPNGIDQSRSSPPYVTICR